MTNQSGWQLAGNGPDIYEKIVVPAFSGAWARDLVARAGLKPGERILDAACGTGIVARHAVNVVGNAGYVCGLDLNEAMIEKGRQIGSETGIDWRLGDMADLPFEDGSFDGVLCQQGIQYFGDRNRALREIVRVLVPGGRFVFSVWRPIRYSPFYAVLQEILGRYVNPEAAQILGSAYKLGDPEKLKALMAGAGFERHHLKLVIRQMTVASLETFFINGMAASPFAGDIKALNQSVQHEMLANITSSMKDYTDDDGLSAPMESYVVTAWK